MKIVFGFIGVFFLLTSPALAQTTYEEVQTLVSAKVEVILEEKTERIIGTDTDALVQTVSARLLEGNNTGQVVVFRSDLFELEAGDRIFLTHIKDIDGKEMYVLKDVDRGYELIFLLLIFVTLLLS